MLVLPEYKTDETHSHHEEVEQIEAAAAETAGMEQEAVGDDFQHALNCKDCCEEIVKIVENLKQNNH